jgi:acetoin utilization deacetylase AcuC-like enzyme
MYGTAGWRACVLLVLWLRRCVALGLFLTDDCGAALFALQIFENDPRVITFSMHGANQSFPVKRCNSDYDVALRDEVDDVEYLRTLSMYIPGLLNRHRPELVFYQAGVDSLASDSLGRMALTRAGLSKRNNLVYSACLERDIPLVVTLGGGYSRPIAPTVDAVSYARRLSPQC